MSVTGGTAGSGVAEWLLAVAQRLSPELETLQGRERAFGVFDVLMDTDTDMFVTVFYGVLDPATGTLTYCNAGHNPPYLVSGQDDGALQALSRTGMALGVLENAAWEQRSVRLMPGDTLVLYTDGITDAEDESGTFFGQERLLEAVQASRGRPAQDVQDALLEGVHAFAGNAPQFDDVTLMVVTRAATT